MIFSPTVSTPRYRTAIGLGGTLKAHSIVTKVDNINSSMRIYSVNVELKIYHTQHSLHSLEKQKSVGRDENNLIEGCQWSPTVADSWQ
jgi:ribosomal protein S24E